MTENQGASEQEDNTRLFNGTTDIQDEISCTEMEMNSRQDTKGATMLSVLPLVTDKICGYLRINDILRFRRVCHWTKVISDEYLRQHPTSTEVLTIAENNLTQFLQRNKASSIRKPVCRLRFYMSGGKSWNFKGHSLEELTGQYGEQITHLELSTMFLPMSLKEKDFYGQFPNLKSLTVENICRNSAGIDTCSESCSLTPFPDNFKNLKRLKIRRKDYYCNSNLLCQLIEHCVNLNYIACPMPTLPHETCEFDDDQHVRLLEKLKGIFEKGVHKNLKVLDFQGHVVLGHEQRPNPKLAPLVCDMAAKLNIKFLHLNLKGFKEHHLKIIAPLILSMEIPALKGKYFEVEFPNVRAMGIRDGAFWRDDVPLEVVQAKLTQHIFPSLRKLVYEEIADREQFLSVLWNNLPALEEVVISNCWYSLEDKLFLGPIPDQPSFLKLTKLIKLTLSLIDSEGGNLSNAVFDKVFRHLGLREFYIHSREPLNNVTTEGIRTLQTGRFNETIEIFPFSTWTLRDVDETQFILLAREFLCNRALGIT